MPGHAAGGCRKPQGQADLTVQQKDSQRAQIGGQIDSLGIGGGSQEIEPGQSRVYKNQEGSGARAVEAVVETDEHGGGHGDQKGIPTGKGFLFCGIQILFTEHVVGHYGQNRQQHKAHQLFAGQQCQGGASPGSQDGADHAGSGQGQIHVSEQPGGGYSGSDGGRQLVCGQGCVGRNAREQVGRKGDQSSASADGVHEARQKDQRTDDEKHMRRHLHDKYLLL